MSDYSSSESVYEPVKPTNHPPPKHNIFGESVNNTSSNELPVERPVHTPPPNDSFRGSVGASSTTSATTSSGNTAVNLQDKMKRFASGTRSFLTTYGQTLLIVCVFVLVAVAVYLMVRSPVVHAWWKTLRLNWSSSTNNTSSTMQLPRDGNTSIETSMHTVKSKSKGSSNDSNDSKVYVTKKKAPKPKPVLERPATNPISPNDKEVFNISNNIYTYEDAPAVCKAYNARLATQEEVHNAFKRGADWCNYGWTQGQVALFPTQKPTFNRMQTIEGHEHDCGIVGVNGGYFQNPDLQFGVNCYGKKPEPSMKEKEMIGYFPDITTDKEKRLQERVAEIKKNSADILITPFNSKQWDADRTMSESVHDWVNGS